ncbi:tyrosine--tRNA ligase [bacterium]|nr:tyrosine--tRNA ligase [bacterium]MBU1599542.1 tyrosine--tRNA ligase [bacterium]
MNIKRNLTEIITESEFDRLLSEKKSPRVKFGADPTAPDIHLGHTVILRKLRQFQEMGAKVIFIIGDFTARIGDPSGRTKTREPLSALEVEKNAATYKEQVLTILDPERTEVLYNSSWLSKIDLTEILKLTSLWTVARMLERDDFSLRYKEEKPIAISEFLYPLLQAYDSVMVDADVEIGGSDQKFNLLLGRTIQSAFGKKPQVVMTMPLLEGTDGKMKMSKSYGNYIGIREPADSIFGKLMSISDSLMIRYYRLLTNEDTKKIEEDIKSEKLHPMKVKDALAFHITCLYHGKVEAEEARLKFKRLFSKREIGEEDAPVYLIDTPIGIIEIICQAGLSRTKSEARRLILQGAVSLDGEKIRSLDGLISKPGLLKIGKRNFLKVQIHSPSY